MIFILAQIDKIFLWSKWILKWNFIFSLRRFLHFIKYFESQNQVVFKWSKYIFIHDFSSLKKLQIY